MSAHLYLRIIILAAQYWMCYSGTKWKLWDRLEFEIVLERPDDGHGGGCRDVNRKKNEYYIGVRNIFDAHLQNILSQWSQNFTSGLDIVCKVKRGVGDSLYVFDWHRWVDYDRFLGSSDLSLLWWPIADTKIVVGHRRCLLQECKSGR